MCPPSPVVFPFLSVALPHCSLADGASQKAAAALPPLTQLPSSPRRFGVRTTRTVARRDHAAFARRSGESGIALEGSDSAACGLDDVRTHRPAMYFCGNASSATRDANC